MDIEQTHAAGKQCGLDKSRAAPRRAVRGFIAEGTISSFSNDYQRRSKYESYNATSPSVKTLLQQYPKRDIMSTSR